MGRSQGQGGGRAETPNLRSCFQFAAWLACEGAQRGGRRAPPRALPALPCVPVLPFGSAALSLSLVFSPFLYLMQSGKSSRAGPSERGRPCSPGPMLSALLPPRCPRREVALHASKSGAGPRTQDSDQDSGVSAPEVLPRALGACFTSQPGPAPPCSRPCFLGIFSTCFHPTLPRFSAWDSL